MNSFTDGHPMFPFQSSEARQELGLPDSSEIHLAVTELAERLLRIAESADVDGRVRRIAALRAASGAVLFGWSLETAELELRIALNMPLNHATPARYRIHEGTDWLSQAAEQLRERGIAVRPDYEKQRSNYGWRYLSKPDQ